jgi:hypothetical protein
MGRLMTSFANLLIASLVVGAMFGIWLIGNPVALSPGAYVEQQQNMILALNVKLPVLGWSAALLTLVSAWLARMRRTLLVLYLLSFGLFIAAGLVTRFLNQPINAIVMTCATESPPSKWMAPRDDWWRWHVVRTSAGVAGLCLLIIASLQLNGDDSTSQL